MDGRLERTYCKGLYLHALYINLEETFSHKMVMFYRHSCQYCKILSKSHICSAIAEVCPHWNSKVSTKIITILLKQ